MSKPSMNYSANEKEMESLIWETGELRSLLSAARKEMDFFRKILSAENPELQNSGSENMLRSTLEQLEELRKMSVDYDAKVHYHRYNLQGMRECDDVSCESFFLGEHLRLKEEIEDFLHSFDLFKNELIDYSREHSIS